MEKLRLLNAQIQQTDIDLMNLTLQQINEITKTRDPHKIDAF